MAVQTRMRPDGLTIRRFSGTEVVAWWCKHCDGKRPTHRHQRRAPSVDDAESAWERHRQSGDHLRAIRV